MENDPVKKSRLQEIFESLKGKSPNGADADLTRKALKQYSQEKDQASTDDWLNENINQPLADRGFPGVGAGLSAVASAGKELLPKDESEFAVIMPGKGLINRAAGEVEGLAAMNYGAMSAEQKAAAAAKRAASEAGAATIDYSAGKPHRYTPEEWAKLKGKAP